MDTASVAATLRHLADLLDAEAGGAGTPPNGDPYGSYRKAPGWLRQAIATYFPVDERYRAAAIAECESGFDPHAHNTIGEDSRGIFQINVGPGAHPELAAEPLFDGLTNVRHAAEIWAAAGGWSPWYNCAKLLGIL